MTTIVRQYNPIIDFDRVGQFLVRTHETAGSYMNWLQPRWEYMHHHPLVRGVELGSIGIWETGGDIVAVVHPEHSSGTVYLQVDPAHAALKAEMLDYAEEHLSVVRDGVGTLRVHVSDRDGTFRSIVEQRGYVRSSTYEEMSRFEIPDRFASSELPEGFALRSLADDNNHRKVHRVLWRGFNHGDEPPDDGIAEREFMQSAPNFRPDLNLAVEAPGGEWVAYCGMWFEPVHAIAYVEPVATDPDFRRLRLGKAVVVEAIRRCADLGATVAYVGATLPIYQSVGFREIFRESRWVREWPAAGGVVPVDPIIQVEEDVRP